MDKKLRERLDSLLEEEKKSAVDQEFLAKLNDLAAQDTLYENFTPTERNTLNEFYRQVKDYLFKELMAGKYGAQIIVDAVIVLCFETGYKYGKGETEESPPS